MIRLTKLEAPEILAMNAPIWTDTLIRKRHSVDGPSKTDLNRYNHEDIKTVLLQETAEKCAYCESKILHVAFGDIEHITPKVLDDALRFDWENLTIACSVCNVRKAAHIDIIDPYIEEPDDYLGYAGNFIFAKDEGGKGDRTLRILDLNRAALRERRYERIRYIDSLIATYLREANSDIAEVIRADFLANEITSQTEFRATVVHYVSLRAPAMLE